MFSFWAVHFWFTLNPQIDLWTAIAFTEGFDLWNYGLDSSYWWQIDFHTLDFINGMFFAC